MSKEIILLKHLTKDKCLLFRVLLFRNQRKLTKIKLNTTKCFKQNQIKSLKFPLSEAAEAPSAPISSIIIGSDFYKNRKKTVKTKLDKLKGASERNGKGAVRLLLGELDSGHSKKV